MKGANFGTTPPASGGRPKPNPREEDRRSSASTGGGVTVLVLFVVIAGAFSAMPGALAAEPRFSSIPGQPVEPGTTVTLTSEFVFDLGTVTAGITQNGVEHVTTFKMDSAHLKESMSVGSKSGGESNIIYGIYRDSDELAQLSMLVINDKDQAPAGTIESLTLTVLVTEMNGNNITVVLTGKKGGVDTSMNATILVKALTSSKFVVGKFMQPASRSYYQGECVPIYALGYNSTVDIIVKGSSGETVTQLTATSKGMLAYTEWKIPKRQAPGNYSFSVKPTGSNPDSLGAAGVYSISVGIEEALPAKHDPLSAAPFSMPGWAPFAMVAAVLIVGVPIGVLLIRKKKD